MQAEEQASLLRTKVKAVATVKERQVEWWGGRPAEAFVLDQPTEGWPDTKDANEAVERMSDWQKQWRTFSVDLLPVLNRPGF